MNPLPQKLKTIGIYIIIMLTAIRFLIVPLHKNLTAKKMVFADKVEVYNTKKASFDRQGGGVQKDTPPGKEKLAELFYPQDQPASAVQAEVLKDLIERAEKKGLTVASFELPEVIQGKSLTEVNVALRFSGRAGVVIEFLGELEKQKRRLNPKVFEIYTQGDEQFVNLTVSAFRLNNTGDRL